MENTYKMNIKDILQLYANRNYLITNPPTLSHINGVDTLTIDGIKYELKRDVVAQLEEVKASIPKIERYSVNGPSIVVFFADGSKQVATCDVSDAFEVETGIMICILKKLCGDNVVSQVQRVVEAQEKKQAKEAKEKQLQKERKEAFLAKQKRMREKKLERKIRKEAEFRLAVEQKVKELSKK